jgi:hypothetical protein
LQRRIARCPSEPRNVGELVPDDRELGQRAVDELLLQRLVAGKREPEHGGEDQQQREEGEEPVVGDEGGEVPALVVGELVHHRDRHPEPPVPALVLVEPLDRSHSSDIPPPPCNRLVRSGSSTTAAGTRPAPFGSG